MKINEKLTSVLLRKRQTNSEVANDSRDEGDTGDHTDQTPPTFDTAALRDYGDNVASPQRSITKKTSQLTFSSKLLYHIDFYSSLPIVSITVVGLFLLSIIFGVFLRFSNAWMNTFVVTESTVTLLMVFTIQHTQGREQVATQRKLDELLRATPGAAESLMMLEEAPREFMMQVEEFQRDVRADIVDDNDVENGDIAAD